MPKKPFEYLKHIRDECEFIISATSNVSDKSDFLENETLKRAVVRSLEIIGEATKKIPVDYSIVWDVIKDNIPELSDQIASALEN